MFNRIDSGLLKLYQEFVNWSHRMPGWWVEQSAILMMLSTIIIFTSTPELPHAAAIFITVVNLCISLCLFKIARSEAILAALADSMLRLTMIWITAIGLVLNLLLVYIKITQDKSYGYVLADMVYDISFLSIYYFAACKPPPPPEPKTKFAFNT